MTKEWPAPLPKDGLTKLTPSCAYEVLPTPVGPPALQSLQDAVGGYIEAVFSGTWRGRHVIMFCNEEGKLRGLPYNPLATAMAVALYHEQRYPRGWSDDIVGDVVVLTGSVARAELEAD